MRLIDADELIDEIKHTLWDWDSVDGIKSSTVLKQTISDINNMPTIDAEPVRHGKWEHGREISRSYIGDACIGVQYEDWKCSNCGIVCEQSDKPKYKYCPVCGAKMEGVEE